MESFNNFHVNKDYINLLTKEISKGNIASGEKLYEIMKYPLYKHVKKFVSSKQDIEDILHDIFLSYFKQTKIIKNYDNCFGLIFKIADRQIYKFLKKNKIILLDEIEQEQFNMDYESNYNISFILFNLNERQKQILILYSKGYSFKEITKIINLSYSTIRRELTEIRKFCNIIK